MNVGGQMVDIRELLHDGDPFEDVERMPFDLQGWGGHEQFFGPMVKAVKPRLSVEVGTWKGKSAKAIAESLDRDAKLLCVDTWLGAPEMWTDKSDKKRYQSLRLKNGYPRLYYQFASNVVELGLQDKIVPFPQSSTGAAVVLAEFKERHGLTPDFVYVDASHEYVDVVQDIELYKNLLSDGGVICGDDFCPRWSGVMRAVKEHALSDPSRRWMSCMMENPGENFKSVYWAAFPRSIEPPFVAAEWKPVIEVK
jgi:predicted O-methyltransferase YrrM